MFTATWLLSDTQDFRSRRLSMEEPLTSKVLPSFMKLTHLGSAPPGTLVSIQGPV